MRVARRYAVALTGLALFAACSGGGSKAAGRNPRPASTVTTTRPATTGTIVGRMYADGGGPCRRSGPRNCGSWAVLGNITVRTEHSPVVVVHPIQDLLGNFRLTVPPGTYQVIGRPTDGSVGTFSTVLVVRAGATARADFGVHMF